MIILKDIHKTYGKGNNSLEALKGIDLTINNGEMLAVMGASGSGKTTLLNIIGTIDRPTSGEYYIDSVRMDELSVKEMAVFRNRIFGFVMQDYALISHYSAMKNIMLPLHYTKLSRTEKKLRAMRLIEAMKLENRKDALPSQMSGGQKQRVAIARALVNDAKILLCDEPTGALDSANAKEIMSILKKLNSEGRTVVIVTHDHSIANECDRLVEIKDGTIIKETRSSIVIKEEK
jgi:putative ABC transport system ATP-binding protein